MRKSKDQTAHYQVSHCGRIGFVIAQSLFLLEQEETLPGLPFLIRVFAGGRLQKVMIVRDRRRRIVQCIV